MRSRRVGARLVAGRKSVLDMPPVIRTGIGRIDAGASTASIACSTRSTFGQPERRSRISPPGRT